MARLESQAKKGYYKTPSHLLKIIATYLLADGDDNIFRLLDPCCGKGEAIHLLGEALNLPTNCLYGNELDEERFEIARKVIPNCLFGDAIAELQCSAGSISLLYENPPYDFEGDDNGRTEYKFLQAHYRFLAHNGILVFVVPETILSRPEFVKSMPVWFKDIRIFRFPPEDYPVFKQVVLFGRKQYGPLAKERKNYLYQLNHPATLGDPSDIVYKIPPVAPLLSFSLKIFHNLRPLPC